jgi:hypothetical protein
VPVSDVLTIYLAEPMGGSLFDVLYVRYCLWRILITKEVVCVICTVISIILDMLQHPSATLYFIINVLRR